MGEDNLLSTLETLMLRSAWSRRENSGLQKKPFRPQFQFICLEGKQAPRLIVIGLLRESGSGFFHDCERKKALAS